MTYKVRSILIALLIVASCQKNYAQASLAAEDMIEEVVVKNTAGMEVSYTLIRDAIQREQWYYMPAQARLYEIKPVGSNETEPEFNLIKFQYNNPANPGELLEGGIIQFSLVMSPDATAMQALRAFITQKTNNPNVRLSSLPLKTAHVNLVTPKGDFIAEGSTVEGIAPVLANSKMVFSVALTRIGTDVYDALTKSNTGMGVSVQFTYNGLTPPAGFEIYVNWQKTHEYFSKHEKKMASIAGAWKWLGGSASYASEKQKMTQELRQESAIRVKVTAGEQFGDDKIVKYMDPILARINTQLLEASQFGQKMDSFLTAMALTPDTTKPGGSDKGNAFFAFLKANAHMSVAVKDFRLISKIEDTISFSIKQLVERKSVAGGFVGLGAYSEAVRKKLQILIANGKWESAYFVLPPISDDDDIGVKRIAMELRLMNKGKLYSSQVFNWTKEKKWTDKNGKERAVAAFPLIELARDDPEMSDKTFEIDATINAGNSVLKIKEQTSAGNSENNIALPLSLVDIVKVDPELLTFKSLTPDAKLAFITVNLTNGTSQVNGSIKPKIINGVATSPRPFYWLLPKSDAGSPVVPNIVFTLTDGTKVNWKGNGKKLNEPGMSYEIILQDADYLTGQ